MTPRRRETDHSRFLSPEVHVGWIIGLLISIFSAGIVMYSKVNSLIDGRALLLDNRNREMSQRDEATRREIDSLDHRVGRLEDRAIK